MHHREGMHHHEGEDPEGEDDRTVGGPHRSGTDQEEGSRDGTDRHSGPEEAGSHLGVHGVEEICI